MRPYNYKVWGVHTTMVGEQDVREISAHMG